MREAFHQLLVGLVMLFFSFPILWFNESRNAKMESLLRHAKAQVRSVGGKCKEANRNRLVHVNGEMMRAAAEVRNQQFNIVMPQGCIRLRRSIETYQIIEHSQSQQREKIGGGKETITTYTYSEEWSSTAHNSSHYHDQTLNRNRCIEGLALGCPTDECSRVEYGDGFLLSNSLIRQCTDFQPVEDLPVALMYQSFKFDKQFARQTDGRYFHSEDGSTTAEKPGVGDCRMTFSYVPDGPATVLALQMSGPDNSGRQSFGPYRLISRGWCGSLSEDQEKLCLEREAKKSASQLADEAGCSGVLGCLCCPCSLVMKCFASALTPELSHLFHGRRTEEECFAAILMQNRVMTWGFRIAGWLMMFIGLYSLFAPFLMLIRVLPFAGPFLSSLGGGLIWFLCLVTTVIFASAVVIAAYLMYHPMLAFFYAAASALCIGCVVTLFKALSSGAALL
jgi:hypothetical protein